MHEKPYKQLLCWQRAHEFALKMYEATELFPSQERYGLISQLRRAALSVPTNIVEGYSRDSIREFKRFLDVSRASLAECEYLMEFSKSVGYLTADRYDELEDVRAKASLLLNRFMASDYFKNV